MSKKFSTKTVDILFVVRTALWNIREGKIIPAYELLSEMYDSVSDQIRETDKEVKNVKNVKNADSN